MIVKGSCAETDGLSDLELTTTQIIKGQLPFYIPLIPHIFSTGMNNGRPASKMQVIAELL